MQAILKGKDSGRSVQEGKSWMEYVIALLKENLSAAVRGKVQSKQTTDIYFK